MSKLPYRPQSAKESPIPYHVMRMERVPRKGWAYWLGAAIFTCGGGAIGWAVWHYLIYTP
jgi:hypothetical protein